MFYKRLDVKQLLIDPLFIFKTQNRSSERTINAVCKLKETRVFHHINHVIKNFFGSHLFKIKKSWSRP